MGTPAYGGDGGATADGLRKKETEKGARQKNISYLYAANPFCPSGCLH